MRPHNSLRGSVRLSVLERIYISFSEAPRSCMIILKWSCWHLSLIKMKCSLSNCICTILRYAPVIQPLLPGIGIGKQAEKVSRPWSKSLMTGLKSKHDPTLSQTQDELHATSRNGHNNASSLEILKLDHDTSYWIKLNWGNIKSLENFDLYTSWLHSSFKTTTCE